jgi:hypothetical protein
MLFALSNKHITLFAQAVVKRAKKRLVSSFGERVPACTTDAQCLCGPYFNSSGCKSLALRAKLNIRLIILIFLFIPGAWCVVHPSL